MKPENIAVGKYLISFADLARMIEAGQKDGMKGALREYEKIALKSETIPVDVYRFKCPRCGEWFTKRSHNQKYCSYKCRHSAQKRR